MINREIDDLIARAHQAIEQRMPGNARLHEVFAQQVIDVATAEQLPLSERIAIIVEQCQVVLGK